MSFRVLKISILSIVLLGLSACDNSKSIQQGSSSVEKESSSVELVIYSARKEHLIKPLFDKFTEETGIAISYITDKAGPLLARLQAEGENTPADILITVDAGNLWQASNVGVLASTESDLLTTNVPSHLRDANHQWHALTIRARTIVYASDRVNPEELSTYESLALPKWKGRLCLRTSKKVYNQSLVAMMIAAIGEEKAEQVVEGWVANLAVDPFSNDTKTMEAIAAGQCDVGIVNTYYYGRLMKKAPELALKLFWPNQSGVGADARGTHINISGAGISKYSAKKAEAQQLIEWLTSKDAQVMLMELNREAAVNPSVKPLPDMISWGDFKADAANVSDAGRLQAAAVKLMDRVNYR